MSDFSEQGTWLADGIGSAAGGLVLLDRTGLIAAVDPAVETLFGYPASELVGKPLRDILPDLDAPLSESWGRAARTRTKGRRKDGSRMPLKLAIAPMMSGGPRTFALSVREIVASRAAKDVRRASLEQAYHAQKIDALGTLAGGIAHDFNNALLPVIGLTELTLAGLPKGSREAVNLSKVLKAAYHAKDLVGQMLAFSRQKPPERRPVLLQEVFREALAFLRAGLPTTIEMRTSLPETPCIVLGDPTQLYQVLVNLGLNARDAMDEAGGDLTVELSECRIRTGKAPRHADLVPGTYYRLSLTDTGCGMDRALIARMFEPFFTTKAARKGSGLGLSVVHGILCSHGGAISVNSNPGRGTTFVVYLPKLDPEAEAVGDGAAHPSTAEDRRVAVGATEASLAPTDALQ